MKKRHYFHPFLHMIGKSNQKECDDMEREEQEQRQDIDDLIFGDEEWRPSNR